MKDSYRREINYIRISVTDLCNLRCSYCMPEEGVCKNNHGDILRFEEFELILKACANLGVNKVRLTGGEPLVRKGIVAFAARIGRMDQIKDLAMTTNGILLLDKLKDLKKAGMNRLNISIDSFDKDKYEQVTRGGDLDKVLEAIEKAMDLGFRVKLNVVLMKGINDDEIDRFIAFANEKAIDVRFIELMPIGEAIDSFDQRYLPLEYVLDRCKDLEEIGRQDPSSPASYYKTPNGKGRIGLIRPISCSFCAQCNRIRLTSDGKLKLCLHSDIEYDLKPLIRNTSLVDKVKALEKYIGNIIKEKPEQHYIHDGEIVHKNMHEIGG